jgi:hypothetical protein
MKNLISVLILPVILFAFSVLCLAQDQSPPEKCEVSGTVTDTKGYVVPGIHIIFSQREKSEIANSNEAGKYKLDLAPGIYDVRLKRYVSFARYERARYEISCTGGQTLNLIELPECYSWGCTVLGYDFVTLSSAWTRNKRLNAVIAYSTKKSSMFDITYKNAMLTFNGYTIAGSRIIKNSRRKTLLVKGPGWIDDGKTRREFESLKIKFTESGIDIEG